MTTLMNGYPGMNGGQESSLGERMHQVVGTVLHFFGNQMTSPRPENLLQGVSVQKDEAAVHTSPANRWPVAAGGLPEVR